jgi:hypothetical protein
MIEFLHWHTTTLSKWQSQATSATLRHLLIMHREKNLTTSSVVGKTPKVALLLDAELERS